MSISGISSNNLLYNLYQSYSKPADSSSGSQSNSFGLTTSESGDSGSSAIGVDLNMLLKALDSGNLSTAQTSFSQLQQDVQAVSSTDDTGASTSSRSTNSNPLANDMSDLGDAISSGDLTGAQSILANIMQHMQGPPPPEAGGSASAGEGSNSLSSDLSNLGNALSSGDTSAAQTILEQIIANLQTTGTCSSDDESDSTSSTSGISSNSNPLAQDLSKLEDALSSGDTTGAQSIFANIMQHMQGPPPPPEAGGSTGTDSVTSVTSISRSSSLSNNLSSLAEALSSGNQTSAQSYFSKLLEYMQSTASTYSSSNSTASASDTSSTTSSNFSLQLENLLATWASLTGTSAQLSTTNIFA